MDRVPRRQWPTRLFDHFKRVRGRGLPVSAFKPAARANLPPRGRAQLVNVCLCGVDSGTGAHTGRPDREAGACPKAWPAGRNRSGHHDLAVPSIARRWSESVVVMRVRGHRFLSFSIGRKEPRRPRSGYAMPVCSLPRRFEERFVGADCRGQWIARTTGPARYRPSTDGAGQETRPGSLGVRVSDYNGKTARPVQRAARGSAARHFSCLAGKNQ